MPRRTAQNREHCVSKRAACMGHDLKRIASLDLKVRKVHTVCPLYAIHPMASRSQCILPSQCAFFSRGSQGSPTAMSMHPLMCACSRGSLRSTQVPAYQQVTRRTKSSSLHYWRYAAVVLCQLHAGMYKVQGVVSATGTPCLICARC